MQEIIFLGWFVNVHCKLSSPAARQNYLNWDLMAQSMESLPYKHRRESKCLFFWKKAPRRARHLNHSLLQDSGCDNIEKGLTAELTELQKAQQLLSVPSSRASAIKPAVCCCKKPSPPSQIPASQPTETNIRGLWRRVNKCWEGDWFWTPIFCSQVFFSPVIVCRKANSKTLY